jgi:hypothetical protein
MGKNKLANKDNEILGSETSVIAPLVLEYCKGRGADLGCGVILKIKPDAIGVDLTDLFNLPGENIGGYDLYAGLSIFQDGELDYIYASHVLEDFEEPQARLIEWVQKIKVGGYLIIILPHGDVYPKAGTPEANPSHKRDWWPMTLREMAKRLPLKLVDEYVPSECLGHSFICVFRKEK